MLIEKNYEVKWRSSTKEHYISKGYSFTNIGDIFLVKSRDFTNGSHQVVLVKCDYCDEIIEKMYATYILQHDDKYGDCCKKCNNLKQRKILKEKYGVENPSQIEEVKLKRKETFVKRFGCENPSQSEEVKQKKVATTLKNYGVSSPLKSEEVKRKARETCMERYGVEYTTLTENMKEKTKQTCMEKYGVDNASKAPEVKEKNSTDLG